MLLIKNGSAISQRRLDTTKDLLVPSPYGINSIKKTKETETWNQRQKRKFWIREKMTVSGCKDKRFREMCSNWDCSTKGATARAWVCDEHARVDQATLCIRDVYEENKHLKGLYWRSRSHTACLLHRCQQSRICRDSHDFSLLVPLSRLALCHDFWNRLAQSTMIT